MQLAAEQPLAGAALAILLIWQFGLARTQPVLIFLLQRINSGNRATSFYYCFNRIFNMRLYSVAVVSFAVGAPIKWTDNLIAHHDIPDVRSRARGVSRGVAWSGLVRIALIRELHLQLGCGVREAVSLADGLLRASAGTSSTGPWLSVSLERVAFEHELQRRLADVLESAPRPRRGRPARRGVA